MNKDDYEPFTCCICGDYFETQFGNNPNPYMPKSDTKGTSDILGTRNTCCYDCNVKKVIPLREEILQVGEEHPLWDIWNPRQLTKEELEKMKEIKYH